MEAGYQLHLGGDLLDEKNVDFCDHTITWKKNGDDASFDQRKSKKKVKKVVKPDSDSIESGSDSASEETNDGASEETNDGASEETNEGASEETNEGAPAKDTFKEEDSMSAAGSDDENSDEEEDSEDDEEIETVPCIPKEQSLSLIIFSSSSEFSSSEPAANRVFLFECVLCWSTIGLFGNTFIGLLRYHRGLFGSSCVSRLVEAHLSGSFHLLRLRWS